MTNSEAIETLKANYPDSCYGLLRDAVDTAIYALSVQPTQNNTSNALKSLDCISRQAAIDALGNEPELWEDPYSLSEDYSKGQRERWNDDREVLLNLPSAEPEPAIPLSWIESYIEWLNSLDNGFSTLEALQIGLMVRKWKDEQNESN